MKLSSHPPWKPLRTALVDKALLAAIIALLAWGLVMLYSASIALPDNPWSRLGHLQHYHFLKRQLVSLALGLVAGFVAFRFCSMERWWQCARWLMLLALILLLAVILIPLAEGNRSTARRWLSLGGMSFQVSEFAKFAAVLYAAHYVDSKLHLREYLVRSVWPLLLVTAALFGLLVLEPDLGAAVVVLGIIMATLFLGGVNWRTLGALVALAALLVALFLLIGWRSDRIMAWLNPTGEAYIRGKGYQITHARIAASVGGLWGQGLGRGVAKLNWLPEAQTDFLLAIFAEELGLISLLVLLALFCWLTLRMLRIGQRAIALDRVFSGLVVHGAAAWLGLQACFHIGVNLGALPTKGLTLPLMSYGGSALIMNLVMLGVVLRVDCENRQLLGERHD